MVIPGEVLAGFLGFFLAYNLDDSLIPMIEAIINLFMVLIISSPLIVINWNIAKTFNKKYRILLFATNQLLAMCWAYLLVLMHMNFILKA